LTEYTTVIQTGTNSIQALKLNRPNTAPASRITVIAAKTNWKYASVESGNWRSGIAPLRSGITARPSRSPGDRMVPGTPTK